MDLHGSNKEFEALVSELCDDAQLEAYKKPYDNYPVSAVSRFLGRALVWCGNLVYGKEPSYLKFRAVEVIARVPYHSWESAVYTLLTMFYTNEKKALKLSTISRFARFAQDNETMHVVVISHIAKHNGLKAGFLRYTLTPVLFAFFYFWASFFLYLLKSRWSLELNYMFEQHAFDQYSRFLEIKRDELKGKTIGSEFLTWYGRHPRSEFDFFLSVRSDEIIHRNQSIHEIGLSEERLA